VMMSGTSFCGRECARGDITLQLYLPANCIATFVQVMASDVAGAPSTSTSTTTKDYFSSDKRPIILYDGVCNM
jgi:hypothetical protein